MNGTRARLLVVVLLWCAAIVGWSSPARAYPWMIKHGFPACANCHNDPSGGELLTEYGRGQGYEHLAMQYGKPWNKQSQPLWGKLEMPEGIRVGGSYRHMTLMEFYDPVEVATFPMQVDLYGALQLKRFRAGGTLGLSRVPAGAPHARAAQVTSGEADAFNLLSRTHWIGYELSPVVLLRAGRINLPFGVRIPEHLMRVRDFTRTDRESDQQHGLAVAFQTSRVRGEVMAIAGNYQIRPDRFRERGASGFVEVLAVDRLGVGLSSLVTLAGADVTTLREERTTRQAHGVFARAVLAPPLVLLVEGDVLFTSNREPGYVGFLQADLEPIQGLHLLATGECADQGRLDRSLTSAQPGAGEPRLDGWLSVDWYFLPQMSFRVDALARQREQFTLLSQFHLYL